MSDSEDEEMVGVGMIAVVVVVVEVILVVGPETAKILDVQFPGATRERLLRAFAGMDTSGLNMGTAFTRVLSGWTI